MTSNGHLLLSAGISAAHYFCANEVEFHTFLLNGQSNAAALGVDGADGNRFMQASDKRNDAWGQAFDGGGHDALGAVDIPISFDDASQKATQNAFKVYKVALVNTSPGGYCMQWHGDIPGSIQAGEILGVRETKIIPGVLLPFAGSGKSSSRVPNWVLNYWPRWPNPSAFNCCKNRRQQRIPPWADAS